MSKETLMERIARLKLEKEGAAQESTQSTPSNAEEQEIATLEATCREHQATINKLTEILARKDKELRDAQAIQETLEKKLTMFNGLLSRIAYIENRLGINAEQED